MVLKADSILFIFYHNTGVVSDFLEILISFFNLKFNSPIKLHKLIYFRSQLPTTTRVLVGIVVARELLHDMLC